MVSGNPIETARQLKAGETAVVMFNDYKKLRTFTVQLSEFNNYLGRQRNVYVHAASKKRMLQMYLVATTAEERDAELSNNNLKGEWRKQIPEEWLNQ